MFGETRIEDVRVGDLVWSKDQHDPDASLQLKRAVQTFAHRAYDLQSVSIADAGGHVETLHATDEHPFFVTGRGWTAAAHLSAGDRLVSPDGRAMTVTGNADDKPAGGAMVYNFEVADAHTYFVADGVGADAFAWVHNVCFGNQNPDVNAPGQTLNKPASSRTLRDNLKTAHVNEPAPGADAAHHIVAGGDTRPAAVAARTKLQNNNIDINEAANGVFLPRPAGVAAPPAATHSQVHTDVYYNEVNRRINAAPNDPDIIKDVLAQIRTELLAGTFPF